jgi:hypothetical protein
MNNRPTAYLVDQYRKPETVVLAAEMASISIAGAEFVPLYKRDDIAPLQVPLVDQHGKRVGVHHRRPSELLTETAYRDADDVIWTAPTAFAYATVCAARHKADMEIGDMRALLAALVDARPLTDATAFLAAQDAARAYLDKTSLLREKAA